MRQRRGALVPPSATVPPTTTTVPTRPSVSKLTVSGNGPVALPAVPQDSIKVHPLFHFHLLPLSGGAPSVRGGRSGSGVMTGALSEQLSSMIQCFHHGISSSGLIAGSCTSFTDVYAAGFGETPG